MGKKTTIKRQYVQFCVDFPEHDKVKELAEYWEIEKITIRIAGVDIVLEGNTVIAGIVGRLWARALHTWSTGDLSGESAKKIARACGWMTNHDILIIGLKKVGLITPGDQINDWVEHSGSYEASAKEQRDKHAAYMAERRAREKEEAKPKKKKKPKKDFSESFGRFWEAYPVKKGRKKAREAWDKVEPSNELVETIIDSVHCHKLTKQWRDGKIEHPTTFLNGELWEDEVSSGGRQTY